MSKKPPYIITVSDALQAIYNEKIIALPTETVYGLFGRADSQKAIDSVYSIKKRPRDNPLICHFYSLDQIAKYTHSIPAYIPLLVEAFCPGPLTFLLQYSGDLFPRLANLDAIACRIPDNLLTLKILESIDIPLFGPSANTSTKVSGVNPDMIYGDLGERIFGIVDGGQCQVGIESTIIDCRHQNSIAILRPGVIGKDEIQKVLPTIPILEPSTLTLVTPGSKYKHYSPNCKVILETDGVEVGSFPILGFIEHIGSYDTPISLGSTKTPAECARMLYATLNSLDTNNYTKVFVCNQSIKYLRNHSQSTFRALYNRLSKVVTS